MDFLNFLSSDNLAVVILLLISGLALVLIGAEVLVDGSSKIAKKLGISDFVIGLSIVAIGTSAPEMVVSFLGAIQGKADISVGNIVGSNVFNTAFVLGISALIAPVLITRTNKRRDVPVNLVVTLLLFLCGMTGTLLALVGLGDSGFASNTISRVEGAVFLLLFIGYMVWSFLSSEKSAEDVQDPPKAKQINVWISLIFIILGIVSLVFGGQVFVSSAEAIAHKAGLSDKFIAVTVLACGTSLPELATSVVAAIKGKGQMAIGNVLGSNVANILLIVGGSALIRPLSLDGINLLDFAALGALALMLTAAAYLSREKLGRTAGAILLAIGVAYNAFLIATI